jgi:hypothetical protein
MMRMLSVLALAVAISACNPGGGDSPDAAATPSPAATATPTPTATARATSNGARSVSEETDDFLFEYSYPAEAGRIAELASQLDVMLEQQRGQLADESQEARRAARADGFPYNKHSYTAEWKVVAALPGWLSLSNDVATYSGGAHGNYNLESLVWDKTKGESRKAIDLFVSPAALEKALGDRFCDELNRQRAKRRGAPVTKGGDDLFSDCPAIKDLTVLVGSSNGRTFNRLTLYAGPYVAGPYAEGAYKVNLSIDRAILDAVKPEFREAFSARN